MASSPITSWEIDGETVETVSDFILRGSKITADGDCSHEIKKKKKKKQTTKITKVSTSELMSSNVDITDFSSFCTFSVCQDLGHEI